jgi:acylphosphatase
VSEEAAGERREVYYSGRVQGVGFRYTVRWVARRFAVTGCVRNLPDGRVQLITEGRQDEVQRFLAAVDTEMGRYVADKQEQVGPPTGRFQGFEIRF